MLIVGNSCLLILLVAFHSLFRDYRKALDRWWTTMKYLKEAQQEIKRLRKQIDQDGEQWKKLMSEARCFECGGSTLFESCGFCGNDLCPMCFECGGGFCSAKHTQEQMDDYEDMLFGAPDAERLAQRKARNELQAIGVLPNPL